MKDFELAMIFLVMTRQFVCDCAYSVAVSYSISRLTHLVGNLPLGIDTLISLNRDDLTLVLGVPTDT